MKSKIKNIVDFGLTKSIYSGMHCILPPSQPYAGRFFNRLFQKLKPYSF